MARKFRISEIKPLISNLAQTSHYQIIFGGLSGDLLQYLLLRGVTPFFVSENAGLLCNSTTLPTSSFATKTADGNYTGIQESFATSRLYNDISMTFYVDSDYKCLTFLETWMEYISSGSHNNKSGILPSIQQNNGGYFIRMQYPEFYKSDMTRIVKFDRNYESEIEYQFIGLFPTSMSSIPVSYGGSEILNVTVTFKYDRYVSGKSLSLNYFIGDQTNILPNKSERSSNPVQTPRTGQALGIPAGVGFIRGNNLIPTPGNPIYSATGRIISN